MPHTTKEGKIFVTYTLDAGSGDIITPLGFDIDMFVWNPVNTTDKLIVREYIADRAKADMPALPFYNGTGATVAFRMMASGQLLIDYAASTTPTGNVITLVGQWMK